MFLQSFVVLSSQTLLIQRNYLNSIDILTDCSVIQIPCCFFSLVVCTSSGIYSDFVPMVEFSFTKEIELFINMQSTRRCFSVQNIGVLCHLLVETLNINARSFTVLGSLVQC